MLQILEHHATQNPLWSRDKARPALPVQGDQDAAWRLALQATRRLSTGAKTPEGIERVRKARTKHGRYSAASIARRREARRIMSEGRALLNVDPAQASDDEAERVLAAIWRLR